MNKEVSLEGLVGEVLNHELSLIKQERNAKTAKTIVDSIRQHFNFHQRNNKVLSGHQGKQSYANKRKTGAEQYYTMPKVVDLCISEVSKVVDLKDRKIIEPAGGTGEFIDGLLRAGVRSENITSFDLDPRHPMVKKGDFLTQKIKSKGLTISITNPPFGRASSLAKKFFNKDAESSQYICYLVPKSWRKWSVQNSLDPYFHLVSDVELPKNCFYLPDGSKKEKSVLNTVFQIWEKRDYVRKKIKIPDHGLIAKVIPKEVNGLKIVKDANFSIIAFGHSCSKCSEVTQKVQQYKTTTMYLKIEDHHTGIKAKEIKEAMRKIDLSKYYNNVAYVQALSIQEINYELNTYFGLENFNFNRNRAES